MDKRLRVSASLLLLFAAALPLWACGIESTLEAQVKDHVPSGFVRVSATAVGGTNYGQFTAQCSTATLSGTVTVRGTVNGRDTTVTVAATLRASGPAGANYCLNFTDPILMQMPLDATNLVGTYTSLTGGESGALIIQAGLSSVPTSAFTDLVAEPGQQLVLLATRDSLPQDSYTFAFDFDLATSRPIDVKLALVGQVICGDLETYYPPIIPCALTSMAQLPAVVIPVSPTPVPITLPLDGVAASCNALAGCGTCAVPVEDPNPIDLRGVVFAAPNPNPTSTGTTFLFVLPGAAQVSLALFDSQGRRVRDLLRANLPQGRHGYFWDGFNGQGRKVGPGVYFARLSVDGMRVGQQSVTVIR